jgi:peptidyl-prolyl cis-trans isomerase A (cyclophilin A)
MDRRQLAVWFVLTLVIVTPSFSQQETTDGEFTPPEGLSEGWYARIDTSAGRIIARLLPEQAPQSVAHFAAMAEGRLEWFDRNDGEFKKGPYYDGIKIHRAVAGRLFEAGDPSGTGYGAPDLFVAPEGAGPINFNAPHRLGMTKEGGVTSGVQFFVTASAQPRLSRFHPCFGIVVSGHDVVMSISQVKTYPNKRPLDPPVLERVRIFKVGDPPPLPEPQRYVHRRREFKAGTDAEPQERR